MIEFQLADYTFNVHVVSLSYAFKTSSPSVYQETIKNANKSCVMITLRSLYVNISYARQRRRLLQASPLANCCQMIVVRHHQVQRRRLQQIDVDDDRRSQAAHVRAYREIQRAKEETSLSFVLMHARVGGRTNSRDLWLFYFFSDFPALPTTTTSTTIRSLLLLLSVCQ